MTGVAIVGPGGVGTFFAAHLASTGQEVVACARRSFTTYIVESDKAPVEAPATVITDPSDVDGTADWVLVGVKAHQTEGAADWLDRLCGPETNVVAMQNGVEAETRLAPYVNGAKVLAAVVYCGATLVEPGHTSNFGGGRLILPDVAAAHEVAALFAGSGARIKPDENYVTEQWRKLGINVALNGVTALTDRPIGVSGVPPARSVTHSILDECWAVGRAEGADLPADLIEPTLDGFAKMAEGNTSMRQDRAAGRPTEHDALYGAVVRFGAKHGIPTPINETIGALVAAGD